MALNGADVLAGDTILAAHQNALLDDIEQHNHDGTDTNGVLVPTQVTITPDGAVVALTLVQGHAAGGISLTNNSTQIAQDIIQTGVLAASKFALSIFSNAIQVNSGLVNFNMANTDSTQNVQQILNSGGGLALLITSAKSQCIHATTDVASSPIASYINDGNNVNRYGIFIQCGTDDGSGDNRMITFFDGNGGGAGFITYDDGVLEIEQPSDMILKTNVKKTKNILDRLLKLNVVDYNFKKIKDKTIINTGFVAQEVKKVFPDMSGYDKKSKLHTVKPLKLIPILVKAVQELTAKVEILEAAT